jgi:hypothetical protein
MKRAGIRLILLALLVAGCARQPSAAPVSPGPPGKASGWDIRYTAVIALARRGSDRIKDHLDTLADMLDEPQQRANCTSRSAGGQEIVDEPLATSIITGTLKAVVELHRRRPEMDLSTLDPAIDKLKESGNPVLRTEAAKTKLALGKS